MTNVTAEVQTGGDDAEVLSRQVPPLRPSLLRRTAAGIPFGIGGRVTPLFVGEGLKAKAMRGSAWTIAGYGASQVLRLGSNLILTRLLFPEAFGLMALVQVFMQGLAMFSDVGIGPSIIQNKRGDAPAFLNTAWTIQVIRGFLLWLGACALAWPAAAFYDQPMLLSLLPVAGLSAVIAGFNSTKLFTANRHLALGRLTTVELASQVVTLVILVGLAWWMRSVWALVIGGLIGAAVKVVLAQTALPGPVNWFRWDRLAKGELFHFGKWIFASTAFAFLASNGDRLLLGYWVPLSLLGAYTIAHAVAAIPGTLLGALTSKVIFPSLTRSAAEPQRLRSAHQKISSRVLMLGGLPYLVLMLAGPALMRLLYDGRYDAAAWIIVPLAAAQWFVLLENLASTVALARGRTQWIAAATGIRASLLLPVGYVGLEFAGPVGAIYAFGVPALIQWFVAAIGARANGVPVAAVQVSYSVVLFIISGSGTLGIRMSHTQYPLLHVVLVTLVVCGSAWCCIVWYLDRLLCGKRHPRSRIE